MKGCWSFLDVRLWNDWTPYYMYDIPMDSKFDIFPRSISYWRNKLVFAIYLLWFIHVISSSPFQQSYKFFLIHLFTCAYIVWVISSPCSLLHLQVLKMGFEQNQQWKTHVWPLCTLLNKIPSVYSTHRHSGHPRQGKLMQDSSVTSSASSTY
jgi:hypothetical protein